MESAIASGTVKIDKGFCKCGAIADSDWKGECVACHWKRYDANHDRAARAANLLTQETWTKDEWREVEFIARWHGTPTIYQGRVLYCGRFGLEVKSACNLTPRE